VCFEAAVLAAVKTAVLAAVKTAVLTAEGSITCMVFDSTDRS
jgi:hypothetical protein